FEINPSAAAGVVVSISGLGITGGRSDSRGGGGILASGGPLSALRLTDCSIASNSTIGNGGGLAVLGGDLHVDSCEGSGNSSDRFGGGLFVAGPFASSLVGNSAFVNNQAAVGGGAIDGFNTTIVASRLVDNVAP